MPQIDIASITPKQLAPGLMARFVHSEHMTLSFVEVTAGSMLAEHAHPHEQVATVIEGEFELTVAGEPIVFGPGSVVVIPSNVRHSGRAITDCKLLDVFTPVREDYRAL